MNSSNKSIHQNVALSHPVTGKFVKAKCMAALYLYLGFSPLFMLPGVFLLPKNLIAVHLLPLAAIILTFTAGLFQGKRRRIIFLLAILLQAAFCTFVLLPLSTPSILLLIPCLVLMLLFMPAMVRPAGLEWSTSMLSYGILLHLIGQVLKGVAVFTSAAGTLSLFFSGYLIACLFAFNRYTLIDAARAEQSPPAKLLNKNRRILAFIAALALLAANWQGFESAVLATWAFLKRAFATILLWLTTLLPQLTPSSDQGIPQGFDMSGLVEATEPSAFSLILEKVLTVLAFIAAALLFLFGLYQLSRLIKRILKKLLARIRDYSRAIGEGYVDKTESLLEWGEVVKAAKDRWESFQKRHKKPLAWESLSPRDKVRRVYALLLKRLKNTEPSLTAREALQSGGLPFPSLEAQNIASLYEQARYSDHPISPEDADGMRKNAGV